jgi:hypothetical protein
VQVAGGNDVTDAQALQQAQELRHGLVMDPRHPLAQTGFGSNRSLQTEALIEETAKGYAGAALGVAGGPLARGAPAAAEGLAIRGLNFAFDPRAGFFRGAATGFGFGLTGFDSAGVEIPGNPAFQRGFAFGEAAGNLVGLIFR